jgi:hypothetical protein
MRRRYDHFRWIHGAGARLAALGPSIYRAPASPGTHPRGLCLRPHLVTVRGCRDADGNGTTLSGCPLLTGLLTRIGRAYLTGTKRLTDQVREQATGLDASRWRIFGAATIQAYNCTQITTLEPWD